MLRHVMVRLKTNITLKGDGDMNKMNNTNNGTKNPYKGKVYRRKSEALSEYNVTLPAQPLPQPKDYEEIEY